MSEHYAISAVRDGFRRAGRQWGRKAEIVAAFDLTDDQLEALRGDESITITPCAVDGPAGATAKVAESARAWGAEIAEALGLAAAATTGEVLAAARAKGGSPGAPGAPATVAELRDALIRAGIGALEPGREDHWTGAGLPEVAALRTATGLAVSAAERDRAWGEIQQGA